MKKSRKMVLLLLPLLITYFFQATQYARAPVKYNYYIVYPKNADISIISGTDLAPDGKPLLQNSTIQEGLYNLTLGQWAPGYKIYYTDSFRIVNREAFNISLISLNFSSQTSGNQYLRIWIQNDTEGFYVGTGNGTRTEFYIGHPYIVGGTDRVYLNGNLTKNYVLNCITGELRFNTPPENMTEITANYCHWVLVWDGIAGIFGGSTSLLNATNSIFLKKNGGTAKVCIEINLIDDPISITENIGYGDNVTVDFYTSHEPIIYGSETVYFDGIETRNYTVYNSEGLIRFVYPVQVTNELLGVGDGIQTRFNLKEKPVMENSETVYLNNTMTYNYTINYNEGYIDFKSPPSQGTTVSCTYKYWFSDPPGANYVYGFDVGTGNGNQTIFYLGHKNIAEDTDKVYLNGILTKDYTISYVSGVVTFNTPPGNNTEITADYGYWVPINVEYQYPRYNLSNQVQSITYAGTIYLWFTSRF